MVSGVGVMEMPPRGHYLAHDVGQLAGVSGKKIGQWARRGLIRSSQSDGTPRVYSYQDIAEAMVVHALVQLGVNHRETQATIKALRDRWGMSWPLQNGPLEVLPATRHGKPASWLLIPGGDSYVRPRLDPQGDLLNFAIDTVAVSADLRRGGWAIRDRPELRHIEVDPERLSGRPTIAGRRVAAEDVALLAQAEDGWEELRDGYGLTDEEIQDAVVWWEQVAQFEAAA